MAVLFEFSNCPNLVVFRETMVGSCMTILVVSLYRLLILLAIAIVYEFLIVAFPLAFVPPIVYLLLNGGDNYVCVKLA